MFKRTKPPSSSSQSASSQQLTQASRISNTRHPQANRIAEVKRLQEIALAQLPRNGLFIVLYLRSDLPLPNDFHWSLYFHTTAGTQPGGHKYHIKNLSNGWITDHGPTAGVFKSNFLCVLIQIAAISQERMRETDAIIRSKDDQINQIPGVSCRVWLMTILAILRARSLLKCNDLYALQEECFRFGNEHSVGALGNDQPRPVKRSRLCEL
jgi:hypothetical protein